MHSGGWLTIDGCRASEIISPASPRFRHLRNQ